MGWGSASGDVGAAGAEVGTNTNIFAVAQRLANWARVTPGNSDSEGMPKEAATYKGNTFRKSTLFTAASALVKSPYAK